MTLLPKSEEENKRIHIGKSHSRSQKCSNNEKGTKYSYRFQPK